MENKSSRSESPGQWLRRARERRGFRTLGEFARALQIDQSQVSRYELDRSSVPDDRAEKIAEVLDIDIITVRRNLGLWVPPDHAEAEADEPEDDESETGGLTSEERRLLERLRTDPVMRRRFFDAVLAGHGHAPASTDSGGDESARRDAS